MDLERWTARAVVLNSAPPLDEEPLVREVLYSGNFPSTSLERSMLVEEAMQFKKCGMKPSREASQLQERSLRESLKTRELIEKSRKMLDFDDLSSKEGSKAGDVPRPRLDSGLSLVSSAFVPNVEDDSDTMSLC